MNAEPSGQSGLQPTVVLVHGAFADASSWNGVIERLQRHGCPVVYLTGTVGGHPSASQNSFTGSSAAAVCHTCWPRPFGSD